MIGHSEITFSVEVREIVGKNEWIGLVGNVPELGNWKLQSCLVLDKKDSKWETTLKLNFGTEIKYRYLLGTNHSQHKLRAVKCWETHLLRHGRHMTVPGQEGWRVEDTFGVCSGLKMVDRGWLSTQSEVRLGISLPKGHEFIVLNESSGLNTSSLTFTVKAEPEAIRFAAHKILPFQFEEIEDPANTPMKIPDSENEYIAVAIETRHLKQLFITIEINDEAQGTLVGKSVISSSMLQKSKGILLNAVLEIPSMKPIATLRIPYLVINPLKDVAVSMENCFTKYWKKQACVHVGHRGSGNSYSSEKIANVRENSIASFNKAADANAYCVEFDVHLSKDLVPIVYHDLTACISVLQKNKQQKLFEIPLFEMTLEEMKAAKLTHKSRSTTDRPLEFTDEESDMSSLTLTAPTLQDVFQRFSRKTGFNVEFKWPTLDIENKYENNLENYVDANVFVDSILKCVFENAEDRRIIFSSFDVDICIMLRRKQNKYPVLFLTNGDTMHYTPMLDLRERTNAMAIGTALSEGFLGLDTLDKDVYKTPDIVDKTHDAGLLFVCYGDDVGDNLSKMHELGVDIAILDRIYEVSS